MGSEWMSERSVICVSVKDRSENVVMPEDVEGELESQVFDLLEGFVENFSSPAFEDGVEVELVLNLPQGFVVDGEVEEDVVDALDEWHRLL